MLTIPKTMTRDDLVIIPRRKYDELVLLASKRKDWVYEQPVVAHIKKRIALATKELNSGKLIPWKK